MSADNSAWGMGFELFARLVAAKYAYRGGALDDVSIKAAAETARCAVRIWHATKPQEPRPLPAPLPQPSGGVPT